MSNISVNNSYRPILKNDDDKNRANELSKSIDHKNKNTILNFGIEAQRKLSRNSEDLLEKIKTKDAGDAGDAINELLKTLNYIDVDALSENKKFLSKIPFIGKYFDKVKNIMVKYNNVSENIDNIVKKLTISRNSLIRDSEMLNVLYEKNTQYINDLNINIEAAYIKLDELKNKIIPDKQKEIENNKTDDVLIQELSDLINFENKLEIKLHDLELSKGATVQSLPQIRLIQNNNNTLVEKIQSSIMTTIPLWKNQVTVALAINRQKKVLDISKLLTDSTNDLLKKNSQLLKQNTIETAKQNERGIIDIETLKSTNKDLISVVEEVQKIQIEGAKKRQKAKEELYKIEQELHINILQTSKNMQNDIEEYDKINNIEVNIKSMFDNDNDD